MTCAQCRESLGAFVDGELPVSERAAVEEHLAHCSECAALHSRLLHTSSQVKAGLMRYEAPDVLEARIRASLAEAVPRPAAPRTSPRARWLGSWTRAVAVAAALVILSSGVTFFASRPRGAASPVQQQILASHIRSLMPGHLTDVASNDLHNVKPWFNGRVNMSPDVPRLDSIGFPLVGGRIDYVDGRTVAAVVYSRRQHIINVFSWPAPGSRALAPTLSSARGYNIIHARRDGEEFWIVSDLNVAELREFAGKLIPAH